MKLRDLIFHITLVKSKIKINKTETIYVEGYIDKKVLDNAIALFHPELIDKVYIDTIQNGAGASWVERQLFIWAKSLTKKNGGDQYLKAVGLFDNDEAGNKAIEKLRKLIELNSAESQTFSIIKNCYKYSPILKSIKSKGISFPTTLEDILSANTWKHADKNKWLKKRNLKDAIIDNDKIKIQINEFTTDNLATCGFTDEEISIILYTINDESKQCFSNWVCSLEPEQKKTILTPINYLILDVFSKLHLTVLSDCEAITL